MDVAARDGMHTPSAHIKAFSSSFDPFKGTVSQDFLPPFCKTTLSESLRLRLRLRIRNIFFSTTSRTMTLLFLTLKMLYKNQPKFRVNVVVLYSLRTRTVSLDSL